MATKAYVVMLGNPEYVIIANNHKQARKKYNDKLKLKIEKKYGKSFFHNPLLIQVPKI